METGSLRGYNTTHMALKNNTSEKSVSKPAQPVVAKSDDGTIQITFTIPYADIEKAREETAKELGHDIEVPGFRKGMAPVSKVIENIPQNTLLEKTLDKILPKLFGQIIDEHKIKPVVYPKFELLKAKEGEDWEIRATTCEAPEISLGNYKEAIKGAGRVGAIWTPASGKPTRADSKPDKEPSREEKEQKVIKLMFEAVNVKIPQILTDEEVNTRLSQLLEKLERLGLSLDSYLASIKKDAAALRSEYEKKAKEAISLDLILSEVARDQNIKVSESEIESAIKATSGDPKLAEEFSKPEKRQYIEVILQRRSALNYLTSLA